MTECFWCQEVFNEADHNICPSCAVNTDTKSIKTVPTEKED
jgi:rRNA maturation endonuclease Nob1